VRNQGGTPYGRAEKKGADITQVLRSQATLRPAYYKVQPATRVNASLAIFYGINKNSGNVPRETFQKNRHRLNDSTTKRINT